MCIVLISISISIVNINIDKNIDSIVNINTDGNINIKIDINIDINIDITHHCSHAEHKETVLLFQSLSVALQRGNAVAFLATFDAV